METDLKNLQQELLRLTLRLIALENVVSGTVSNVAAFPDIIKDIMKRLERIALDGRKLGDDFKRLGKHLSDARGSYDDTEKRLSLMVDRVQNVVELEEVKKEEKLLE